MQGKLGAAAALMSAVVGITPIFAATKHHQSHASRPVSATGSGNRPVESSFAPPRMIEVRPGVWVSSYDCITDDGYGRWLPCSAASGGR